ncbi:MAG: phosphoribosylanthranilate isomerase [Gammaproteobacteria bacterium]|nr:phosphoribosylanthranilate isomerase [Gammaproteobacteria bacterium]
MTNRTRIKVCGLTQLDQALYCAELGADSIGLVFHPPSSRLIEIDAAINIRRALPPFVTVTALFLDEQQDWMERVVNAVRPDCLQFHGNETVEVCEQFELPYIKSIPMASVADAQIYANSFAGAQGFLMDSNMAGRMGGSGDTFDWSRIPASFGSPIILAGGLNSGNVAEAIALVKPWGVDVSSGVEAAKGIKDRVLLKRFFTEVQRCDART